MSHTGLGGRLRGFNGASVCADAIGAGRGADGGEGTGGVKGGESRSSSMSHTGLGGLAFPLPPLFPALAPTRASARCLPLSFAPSWARLCEENGRIAVPLARKGFSNASRMRRALTWPKPGSWRSCAEDARAMSAKLCVRVCVSGFCGGETEEAEGAYADRGAEDLDVGLVDLVDARERGAEDGVVVLVDAFFD
jgi:hypothetical protein